MSMFLKNSVLDAEDIEKNNTDTVFGLPELPGQVQKKWLMGSLGRPFCLKTVITIVAPLLPKPSKQCPLKKMSHYALALCKYRPHFTKVLTSQNLENRVRRRKERKEMQRREKNRKEEKRREKKRSISTMHCHIYDPMSPSWSILL